MIEAMGWTRGAVYIANTTKCRPPNNRNPEPDELGACMPFLHQQIAAIAPRIIVALGRPASNQLLEVNAPISALRGKFHDYPRHAADRHSLKIMPTFHPAYLLRDPDKKRAAWADLKLVMAELERLGIAAPGAGG
jgi:DNA polymerase